MRSLLMCTVLLTTTAAALAVVCDNYGVVDTCTKNGISMYCSDCDCVFWNVCTTAAAAAAAHSASLAPPLHSFRPLSHPPSSSSPLRSLASGLQGNFAHPLSNLSHSISDTVPFTRTDGRIDHEAHRPRVDGWRPSHTNVQPVHGVRLHAR
jgi:hypothetical protein